jgi:hypothetical protein
MLALLAHKQTQFDHYARESDLADGLSDNKDISEETMAKTIVTEERKRLGINESDLPIQVKDPAISDGV